MATKEIPVDEWGRFFEGLASSHRAWLVKIQVSSFELGAQTWVEGIPLKDISVEREADGNARILIGVGSAEESPALHIVRSPRSVWLKTTEEGAEEVIEIVGKGGTLTLLTFRTAFLPQLVDGVTADQI